MKFSFKRLSICLIISFNFITYSVAFSQSLKTYLKTYQDILRQEIKGQRAFETVEYLQQFWRNAGNTDFNTAMDHIANQLKNNGFSENDGQFQLQISDALIPKEKAWQPYAATLKIISPIDTLLHSLQQAKMFLGINSHSTPANGVTGPIVFVDQMGKIADGSLTGKIAYTHRPPQAIFQQAVRKGNAMGIISSYLPGYNQPRTHRHSLSMGSIPQVDQPRIFAFKISYGSQMFLDSLLAKGPVMATAKVETKFFPKKVREVSAQIVGAKHPRQIIILIAHLDEPGANDNASGSATLLEIATMLKTLIEKGALKAPARTIKFMWVEEIGTVLRWEHSAPKEFNQVMAAFVLDMVGEDVRKTGGSFLIEKMPDPSAIWTRPPDKHTEWGKSQLPRSQMPGSYLNDLFFLSCEIVAQQEGWTIRTNPFEGGSDHVPFLRHGIPAILAWHFTDVYYHTNGDQIDKVSPEEMRRVGLSTASTALFLASCSPPQALALGQYLELRGDWRMNNETANSLNELKNAKDPDSSLNNQEQILRSWMKWYYEAFESIEKLPITSKRKKDIEKFILKSKNNLAQILHLSMRRLKNVAKTLQNSHH